jgi:hypothetical protein
MKLRELAHSRTGDKGNTLNISVICYDARHYEHLRAVLSAERVRRISARWCAAMSCVTNCLPLPHSTSYLARRSAGA